MNGLAADIKYMVKMSCGYFAWNTAQKRIHTSSLSGKRFRLGFRSGNGVFGAQLTGHSFSLLNEFTDEG